MSLNSPPLAHQHELKVLLPSPDYEMCPPRISDLLRSHGWTPYTTGSKYMMTHALWPGYYSWVEALCLEMAPAFLAVHEGE